jgi:hypothetical protein
MPSPAIVLLWIVSGTVTLACLIAFLADAGLLDWLYESQFMAWFDRRLWTPLKRITGVAAIDRWLSRRGD